MTLPNANVVTDGNYSITFAGASGTAMNWAADQTATAVNGVASISVDAGAAPGSDTFTAGFRPGGVVDVTSAAATMQVGSSGAAKYVWHYNPNLVVAGQAFDVPVRIGDTVGEFATSDNGTVVTLTFRDYYGVTRGTFSGPPCAARPSSGLPG